MRMAFYPAIASLLLVCCTVVAGDSGNKWTISKRLVPAPMGASEVLRNAIIATPAPDVRQRLKNFEKIDWGAMKRARAASRTFPLSDLGKYLNVEIRSDEINGVKVHHVIPSEIDPKFNNALFLYLHGGAYVFGAGDNSVSEAAVISNTSKIRALSVDYRMPPADPFPAAVDDVVPVYRHVLKTTAAKSIAIGGTSAGGGLSLAAVHQFISLNLDVPGAIYAGTPWSDLTKTGDTLYTNEGLDRILVTYDGLLKAAALLYADGNDLKNPLLSPVYGSFDKFPPTYLVTGTRDLFLSDTVRVHRKLRTAGIVADLNVYEALSHAGYVYNPASPESQQTYGEMREFLRTHLQ